MKAGDVSNGDANASLEEILIERGVDVGEDSLSRRYRYKLLSNLAGVPFNLAVQAIVPRALGPEAYGSFNFLTNFFQQVISFFDSGTSQGFYTKLCQRPHERAMVTFYWRLVFVMCAAVLVGVELVCLVGWSGILWPDQSVRYAWMAAIYGLGLWLVIIVGGIMDAYGQTVRGEIGQLIRRGILLALLAGLAVTGTLNLATFFGAQCVVIAFVIGFWCWTLGRVGRPLFSRGALRRGQVRSYGSEFWTYSHPLIVYSLIGMIGGVFERWLLQRFGGSTEQGFYGLAFQVGNVCFLFTSAMTPLLMREFSQAAHTKDLKRLAMSFSDQVPRFYFIAAYFGIFLAIQADAVVRLFGGKGYSGAAASVGLMCLYPLHRTYGQLSNSVFLATGQTALYRNLGVAVMVLGLVATWVLLAPRSLGGLNLEAYGLGLKMVGVQFVEVNLRLWFNTRYLSLSFAGFLWHQIIVVALLGALAGAAKVLAQLVTGPVLLEFLLAGVLYTAGALAVVWLFPQLAGLRRGEILSLLKQYATR